jgi:hypothetical protein
MRRREKLNKIQLFKVLKPFHDDDAALQVRRPQLRAPLAVAVWAQGRALLRTSLARGPLWRATGQRMQRG